MKREIIICILIILVIYTSNQITQKFTNDCVQKLSQDMYEIRGKLYTENVNNGALEGNIKLIEEDWENRKYKLAYYIEHNELEKIETNITSMKSFIETEEYTNSINEIDKAIFILNHIKDKYTFTLENIF